MGKAAPQAAKPVLEPTRPHFPDYFLILSGLALSVLLGEISGLKAEPAQTTSSPLVHALARAFPGLLLLSLGVVLLWPIFYVNQRILGRKQELTWAEWLWGLAWLGSLLLALWLVWNGLGSAPEFMASSGFKNGVMIGYVLFVLSMGGLAAVLYIVGVLGRWTLPWTHTFGLALLMWPLVPLTLWWLTGIKLE